MKNIGKLYLLGLIILLSVASCKKKKDDSTQSKLYGSWKLVSYALDDNNNNVIDAGEIETYPNTDTSILTFNGDGTGAMKLNDSTRYVTWSLNDKNELLIKNITSLYTDSLLVDALLDADMTLHEKYFNGIANSVIWYSYKKQ